MKPISLGLDIVELMVNGMLKPLIVLLLLGMLNSQYQVVGIICIDLESVYYNCKNVCGWHNSSSKTSAPLPSAFASTARIGSWFSIDQFNSLIDDLRISNKARSDAEILAAYQSGQPAPVDEWTTYKADFDEKIRFTHDGKVVCEKFALV